MQLSNICMRPFSCVYVQVFPMPQEGFIHSFLWFHFLRLLSSDFENLALVLNLSSAAVPLPKSTDLTLKCKIGGLFL